MLKFIKLAFIAGAAAGLAGGTALVLTTQGIYGMFRRKPKKGDGDVAAGQERTEEAHGAAVIELPGA